MRWLSLWDIALTSDVPHLAMRLPDMGHPALGVGALKMKKGRMELSIGRLTVDELVVKKRVDEE